MSDTNPTSHITRTKYGAKRETTTVILEADNASIRNAKDGSLVIELFRYSTTGNRPVESFTFHLCQLDKERVRKAL